MLMVGPTSLGCSFDSCCQLSLLTSEAVSADKHLRLKINQHARSDDEAVEDLSGRAR